MKQTPAKLCLVALAFICIAVSSIQSGLANPLADALGGLDSEKAQAPEEAVGTDSTMSGDSAVGVSAVGDSAVGDSAVGGSSGKPFGDDAFPSLSNRGTNQGASSPSPVLEAGRALADAVTGTLSALPDPKLALLLRAGWFRKIMASPGRGVGSLLARRHAGAFRAFGEGAAVEGLPGFTRVEESARGISTPGGLDLLGGGGPAGQSAANQVTTTGEPDFPDLPDPDEVRPGTSPASIAQNQGTGPAAGLPAGSTEPLVPVVVGLAMATGPGGTTVVPAIASPTGQTGSPGNAAGSPASGSTPLPAGPSAVDPKVTALLGDASIKERPLSEARDGVRAIFRAVAKRESTPEETERFAAIVARGSVSFADIGKIAAQLSGQPSVSLPAVASNSSSGTVPQTGGAASETPTATPVPSTPAPAKPPVAQGSSGDSSGGSTTSKKTPKRVLCLGDSITADGRFVKKLRELTGGSVKFDIAATVGHPTSKMLARIKNPSEPGYADLSKYDGIIVLGGVNNIWAGRAKILSDLKAICDLAKKKLDSPKRIIALTVLPYKGYSSWNAKNHEEILAINKALKAGGTGATDVVDIFPLLSDPGDRQRLLPNLTGDKLHPNGAGQEIIGKAIYDAVFTP